MTLGAFVSAGVSIDYLTNELRKLNVDGIELYATHTERCSIAAVKLEVMISPKQHHSRNLKEIHEIIDNSKLNDSVKNNAKKIFKELGQAEAKVHKKNIDEIHFHEVGALDSIVDIVGTAICLDKLCIQKVYTSPIKLGCSGFVETEHGRLPIPSPATVEILKNYPTLLTDIPFELTTPTGAAIVKAMSLGVLTMEQFISTEVGYGAGSTEISKIPNVLRLIIGELNPYDEEDSIILIETNLDNMNPEIYPFVIEKLLSQGALDAYLVPIIMKKGRPGIILSTIVEKSKIDGVLKIFFMQTSTLGVRLHRIERRTVIRELGEKESSLGKVKVKIVKYGGKERIALEYEECKRLADGKKLALIEVYRILEKELNTL